MNEKTKTTFCIYSPVVLIRIFNLEETNCTPHYKLKRMTDLYKSFNPNAISWFQFMNHANCVSIGFFICSQAHLSFPFFWLLYCWVSSWLALFKDIRRVLYEVKQERKSHFPHPLAQWVRGRWGFLFCFTSYRTRRMSLKSASHEGTQQ